MSNTQKMILDPARRSVVIASGNSSSWRPFFCLLTLCAAWFLGACTEVEIETEVSVEQAARVSTVTETNLTTSLQGPSGLTLNGMSLNGMSLNGVGLNGVSLQGMSLNGMSLNGMSLNGMSLNGMSLNGMSLNGLSLNDLSLGSLSLAGITLNGLRLDGLSFNGVSLPSQRLNGVTINGVTLGALSLSGLSLDGVRLNGMSLSGIKLGGAKLAGAPVTSAQMTNVKLALGYVAKCALRSDQCVTVTDVDGVSTYSMCGESGLDASWNTNLITSVANEAVVTECVLDISDNDAAHPSNVVSHTNREAATIRDFFNHAVACALPSSTCVTVVDIDGVSTYQSCGIDNLDPAWLTGPATQGTVANQVATCVKNRGTAHGDSWVDFRDQLKTVLKYSVECALRSDQTMTGTDWDGLPFSWPGQLGLSDWWLGAALNPAPSPKSAVAGEELVSACLMARTNARGRSVSISVRARPELSPTAPEAAAYTRHEGAFMGNLFSATPVIRSCSGAGGNNWLSDPSTNAGLAAGRECAAGTACGFEYLGACTAVCNVKPGVGGETMFDDCSGNSNVVNTFLFASSVFDVNDTTSGTTARTTSTITGSTGDAPMVAAADFNEDGYADLAVENNGTSVLVRLGLAAGGFAADVTYSAGASVHVRSVIAKDVNADGHVDLVTANDTSLSVLLGTGGGMFGAATTIAVTNAAGAAASVAAADFNNDGKVDLATNLTSGVGLFIGTGTGTFGTQSTITGASSHKALVAGDWNGDGKRDLASVSQTGASLYVQYGNGNGTFAAVTTISAGTAGGTTKSLTAGDFNNDGKVDLAAAVAGDNTVRVFLGSAGGTFSTATYTITGAGTGTTAFVAAAYLNGDGAMDLVVGRGNALVFLSGSATGAFTATSTFDMGEPASGVVAGHFDRDVTWRMDLIASADSGKLVQLLGE
jgi:uncharacterized protein YjbI with pentapeptide repeats